MVIYIKDRLQLIVTTENSELCKFWSPNYKFDLTSESKFMRHVLNSSDVNKILRL